MEPEQSCQFRNLDSAHDFRTKRHVGKTPSMGGHNVAPEGTSLSAWMSALQATSLCLSLLWLLMALATPVVLWAGWPFPVLWLDRHADGARPRGP